MKNKIKFGILVGTVPTYKGKILLTQRSFKSKFLPGVWGMVAGKVEFKESIEEAVHRELLEEIGVDGEIIRIIGTNTFTGEKNGVQLHNVQINFLVELNNDKIVLDESSNDYKWVEINEYKKLDLDKFHLRTLSQAFGK